MKKLAALLLSLALIAPPSLAANTGNTRPLKSVMPLSGVGIDLENECLGTSVLPAANGGSGSSSGAVPTTRTITAGTGLSGGGDLSANRTISLSTPVSVANGGSGAGTFTANGVLYGAGTSALGVTAQGAAGIPLIGAGASAPVFGTATVPGDTPDARNCAEVGTPPRIAREGSHTIEIGELYAYTPLTLVYTGTNSTDDNFGEWSIYSPAYSYKTARK